MSFNTPDDTEALMSEMNLTPLVDVMLVLLVVFMITLPVLTHAVKTDLPQAASTPEDLRPASVSLAIDAGGTYRWDDEIVTQASLDARLRDAAKSTPQPEIRIQADRDARYDAVAQLLAAAQRAGLSKVGFVTQP